MDIFTQAIEQAVAEGGQAERGYTVPGDDPDRNEWDDDRDGKDMDPHYGEGEWG